ncbi:MAG: IS1634 family transposase [Bacillota bacterium]|nr:IS1634 family transposase [Bacillota bacterium]
MFIRTTTARGHRYVQLVHNYRDPQTRVTKTKVVHSFGREDRLDLDALRRLVRAICRYLEPDEGHEIQRRVGIESPFQFAGSLELGGAWLLDQVWKRLQMDSTLRALVKDRSYAIPVERLLFALVANRALAPSSKLAMENWVGEEVWIPGLETVEVHQLYRVMDLLYENVSEIERSVYFSVANLLNLEVDVIFFDTTTTYFEIEGEDSPEGLRRRGYSKDDRPGLAQAVIGFAVTRDGIPVRSWVWPGNTVDQNIVTKVKQDLNEWKLGRMLIVLDTGFNSPANRRALQGAGDHYIIGEKMRLGRQAQPASALRRAGRYRKLDCGLEIKEVLLGGDSVVHRRFVVVYNPEEAERDRKKRQDIVAEAERRLAALQQLEGEPHNKAACALRAHPAYGRYLKQSKTGRLCLNRARIRAEAAFDGKFLVSSSDEQLSAEEIVLGYKQLWRIERVHRDLKHVVDVRPVYHRLEDRIRSHVLLCWLALLLIRVVENETEETWSKLKPALAKLKVGIHRTQTGEFRQTTPLTAAQSELFQKLKLQPPPRYLSITAAARQVV